MSRSRACLCFAHHAGRCRVLLGQQQEPMHQESIQLQVKAMVVECLFFIALQIIGCCLDLNSKGWFQWVTIDWDMIWPIDAALPDSKMSNRRERIRGGGAVKYLICKCLMRRCCSLWKLYTHLRKLRILSNTRGSDIFSDDTWMLSVISTCKDEYVWFSFSLSMCVWDYHWGILLNPDHSFLVSVFR